MPQSLSKVAIHIIYSSKNHISYFKDDAIRNELHAYLGGICKALGCTSIIVGGWIDHVHILCYLNRTISISNLIKEGCCYY
jgi:putative transposase